jgi:hypothetical protein
MNLRVFSYLEEFLEGRWLLFKNLFEFTVKSFGPDGTTLQCYCHSVIVMKGSQIKIFFS